MATTQTAFISIEEPRNDSRLSIPKSLLTGLDPEWVSLWERHGSSMVRADELSLEEFRKDPAAYSFTFPTCPGYRWRIHTHRNLGPPVFHVEDLEIPVSNPAGNIMIRVYTPAGPGPFPVHLNFHGGMHNHIEVKTTVLNTKSRLCITNSGGWVLGNLNSEAAWCRHMCNKAQIKIVDVDYRLAPEFPYPTSIYDSWDAVKWVITMHYTRFVRFG
ncbi:Alpha/beta hydrolase fold-3 [Penicillium nucicola]|uniref:Alpha/beta hydrolase fold-3 n=1 Tax=Penicillium nucicola TaxID=1850975 RepID=UPI0025452D52|nr:Alpha/beta hydrolase fold-3 [Penicillium nucicola]KAJ5767051.1 Alpha/beta hydrolase fold-3 [Penicillium nucicola]